MDVDLATAQLRVVQQLVDDNGHITVAPPKSAASRQVLALDNATVDVLRQHRRHQQDAYGQCDYVFTDADGRRLRPGNLTHAFTKAVRASGLPPIRLHDLRHGAATLALAAGVDLKTIQDMLGDATIVTTADIYTSVLPVQRAAAEAIAALLTPHAREAMALT
jgi:integrase